MKHAFTVLALSLFTVACSTGALDRVVVPEYEYVSANFTIADLRKLYNGQTLNINDDIIIAGWVTANDRSNNFYRSFVMQDNTGAIEVKAGMFDLHNVFRMGRRVAIKGRGLAIGSYNGVLQIGRQPVGTSYQTDYIASRYYPGSCFCPQEDYNRVVPLEIGLSELSDRHCGTLVRIDGLRFADDVGDGYITWAVDKQTSYRRFENDNGTDITVQTSGYADFAARRLPRGKVRLTGILMRGNTDTQRDVYMLKLRDWYDVEEL